MRALRVQGLGWSKREDLRTADEAPGPPPARAALERTGSHRSQSGSPASIGRTFGETRRRVKVIGRLPGEQSCLSLVWAVLDRASKGWRGLTMTPKILRQLQDLRRDLLGGLPARQRAEDLVAETVTAAA